MVAVILISAAFRFSTSHTTDEYTYEEVHPFSQEKYSKLRKWCLDKLLCEYTISAGVQKPTEALWGHLMISFLFFTFSFLFLTFCFLLRHFAFRLRFSFLFFTFPFSLLTFWFSLRYDAFRFFYFFTFPFLFLSLFYSYLSISFYFSFNWWAPASVETPSPKKKIWSRVCPPPQEPMYEGTGRLYIGCVCGAESIFLSRVEGSMSRARVPCRGSRVTFLFPKKIFFWKGNNRCN